MGLLTRAGITLIGLAALADVASGAGGGVVSEIPQWLVMVGLTVLCPEDINAAIRQRIGSSKTVEKER